MGLAVRDFDLGDGDVEGYFLDRGEWAAMAIQKGLPDTLRRARELEARGYWLRPPRQRRKFCLKPGHPHDYDEQAINAIRCVIDELQPSWVSEVKEAARMSGDPRWIAAWCELSLHAVVAILLNLEGRGELL